MTGLAGDSPPSVSAFAAGKMINRNAAAMITRIKPVVMLLFWWRMKIRSLFSGSESGSGMYWNYFRGFTAEWPRLSIR